MGRFASTVPFYVRARQPYGQAFFDAIARDLPLAGTERLLDLGTGPGPIAVGLAAFVRETWGVDPEPAMLAAARAAAERASVTINLLEGAAEDLPIGLGPFDVVTIGRALQWMDPDRARVSLDRVVGDGGSIVICSASTFADDRNPWRPGYEALRARWSGDVRHGRGPGQARTFFQDSMFRPAGTIKLEHEHTLSIDDLADRILSMSTTSPDKLGTHADSVRREALDLLAPFAEHGTIRETVLSRADVFRRPT